MVTADHLTGFYWGVVLTVTAGLVLMLLVLLVRWLRAAAMQKQIAERSTGEPVPQYVQDLADAVEDSLGLPDPPAHVLAENLRQHMQHAPVWRPDHCHGYATGTGNYHCDDCGLIWPADKPPPAGAHCRDTDD